MHKLFGHNTTQLYWLFFQAIVYKPYSVMSYTLTEFYSLNIPLFMPSPTYFRTKMKGMGPDRSINKYYCMDGENQGPTRPKHPDSPHPYSPNVDFGDEPRNGEESELYWLQFADGFDLPHITHFDSYEDLLVKLSTANFTDIHMKMLEENRLRKHSLLKTWCDVIHQM